MGRIINLGSTKTIEIVVKQSFSINTDSIEVVNVTDDGITVVANVSIQGQRKDYLLWEGQAYIDIGNWTDESINARLLELL